MAVEVRLNDDNKTINCRVADKRTPRKTDDISTDMAAFLSPIFLSTSSFLPFFLLFHFIIISEATKQLNFPPFSSSSPAPPAPLRCQHNFAPPSFAS